MGPSGDAPPPRSEPTERDAPRYRASDVGDRHAGDDLAAAGPTRPGGWLADLLWTLGPVAPRSNVVPGATVKLQGQAGGIASGTCTVRNEQAAAISAVLAPSPLVATNGFVWLPTSTADAAIVVPARGRREVDISVFVPADLPPGTYRGSLVVLGTLGVDVDLDIVITGDTLIEGAS
jgi:hypothetical protein